MRLKKYTMEEVGAVIRTRRKELKATQRDLAMTSNTGLRFIVDLEKGKPTCQMEKVLKVLQMLGIKVDLVGPDEK